MVLCSAQFQQSDPDGCTSFSGQAVFSSSTCMDARTIQCRAPVARKPGRVTHRRLMPLHGGDQCLQSHKGLALYGAGG